MTSKDTLIVAAFIALAVSNVVLWHGLKFNLEPRLLHCEASVNGLESLIGVER